MSAYIRECTNCGHDEVDFIESVHERCVFLRCPKCLKIGPKRQTLDSARVHWNRKNKAFMQADDYGNYTGTEVV